MAIEGITPIQREVSVSNAVSQSSLTKAERELQVEGQPPMEVSEADQSAVQWRKEQDLREKWRRRVHSKRQNNAPGTPEIEEAATETGETRELENHLEGEAEVHFDVRS